MLYKTVQNGLLLAQDTFLVNNLRIMDSEEKIPTINGSTLLSQLTVNQLRVLLSEAGYYNKKVLTLDEVVEYTGFAKHRIYKLTSQSIIPHSKPTGKSLFFEREKLEAWLLSGYIKSNTEIDKEADREIAARKKKKK